MDTLSLPNPEEDLEAFLIIFLDNYQSDERVFMLNEYYKLLYKEFEKEVDEITFKEDQEIICDSQIAECMEKLESTLTNQAHENFHNLVLTKKIALFKVS